MWVAIGGLMSLIVVVWAFLLPMQFGNGTLLGAREIAEWQVYRPKAQEVSKNFSETMDKWKALLNDAARVSEAQYQAENLANINQQVSQEDVDKLRAKIEKANATNQQPAPK